LDAPKRYAEIAPAAPHAQHMPSHIFTRVGYWKESIAANSASARSAKEGKEPHGSCTPRIIWQQWINVLRLTLDRD
jgi:hypothetical protein